METKEQLEKWFKKWMRKPVSGRCFVEVKEIAKDSNRQGIQKAIKDEIEFLLAGIKIMKSEADYGSFYKFVEERIEKLNQEVGK